VPRRGIVVLRKTRQEIIDLIIAWASLESMAARLFVIHAPDDEVAALVSKLRRTLIATEGGDGYALTRADGISEIHDAFVGAPGCGMIRDMTKNLLVQMRWINNLTGGHAVQQATELTAMRHRMAQAIESRDADLTSSLIRDHNLDLARHIETCCDFLD
jgi:DNA-binding GntR family transcriptional regulator